MIKKKAKDMIGARKLQRAKKTWNKGRVKRLDFISKMLQVENETKALYLLKPGTRQNNPKPAKRTQIQAKRSKTSQNDPKKLLNNPKQPKISKFSTSLGFSNFKPKF